MSDRELDGEIARIMGWRGIETDGISLYGRPPESEENPHSLYSGTGTGKFHVPRFSTKIEWAWRVVEKVRERGFIVRVESHPDEKKWLQPPYEGAPASEWRMASTPEHYGCYVARYDADCDDWISAGDAFETTAPKAICLAALAALRQQDAAKENTRG